MSAIKLEGSDLDEQKKQRITHKLRVLIASELDVPESAVTEDAAFGADLGADSLVQAELIHAVEDGFALNIPDDIADKIKTFGDALAYILSEKISSKA